jgi:hypothetical protein
MKEQIDSAIELIKKMPVKGCITGSSLLGEYWEGMDVDIFVYDEKSFNKILFAMHYNDMFQITDKLEQWKFDKYITDNKKQYGKAQLVTIKFMYNVCIPINVILKSNCTDIFAVLSSFDLDIVCKGYDIETGRLLDLSENLPNKQATWNRWNTSFYNPELWQISRILRQLERVFKYYKRGYNTDLVATKYMELIDQIQATQNIFSSESYSEKLKIRKANTKIVKRICETWLKTHEISEKEVEVIKEKIKEI